MREIRFVLLALSLVILSASCRAQKKVTYKEVKHDKLVLQVFYPKDFDESKKKVAMVFFFGGGWLDGGRSQFRQHAKYFSDRGLVCFLADYRTKHKNNTSPFESVKDAKSAMRYIRSNAKEFGVDPDQIIASGGSAGGHLAASTAFITEYNDKRDDLSVSSVPNALVLFNPVIDNGPEGYGYDRIGDEYPKFSPMHNIKAGAPPIIFFLGTKDHLIPVATAEKFKEKIEAVGGRCDLFIYEGEDHGFFNYDRGTNMYKTTLLEADKFLQSLGYLKETPKVEVK